MIADPTGISSPGGDGEVLVPRPGITRDPVQRQRPRPTDSFVVRGQPDERPRGAEQDGEWVELDTGADTPSDDVEVLLLIDPDGTVHAPPGVADYLSTAMQLGQRLDATVPPPGNPFVVPAPNPHPVQRQRPRPTDSFVVQGQPDERPR